MANAQEENDTIKSTYTHGIGIRGGETIGVTYKGFFSPQFAFEAIASRDFLNVVIFSALIEKHNSLLDIKGLNLFYGGGLYAGILRNVRYTSITKESGAIDYREDHVDYGINAIGGIEYYFMEVPFTIGVDVKPAVDLYPRMMYFHVGGALTVRYVIK